MLRSHEAPRLICAAVILALSSALPLPGQVKQVRVTAERAAIQLEPRRDSARITTVENGTVLDLFQPDKVRESWYYVAFHSAKYGMRVSGFIDASLAEPVGGEPKPVTEAKPARTPAPARPKAPESRAAPTEETERDLDVAEKKWPVEEPYLRFHGGSLGFGCTTQSNMFQEFGAARPEVATSVSGDLTARINLARRLTLFPRLAFTFNKHFQYPTAGYPEILAGLGLKHRGHAVSLEWTQRSRRLLYISSVMGEVVYDSRSLDLSYKWRMSRRLAVKLDYAWVSEAYVKPADARDMSGHGLGIKVNIDLNTVLGCDAGFDVTRERARDMDHSLTKSEPWMGARLTLPLGLQLYARYKRTLKGYTTERPGDRNLGRKDTYHNYLVELKIPLRRDILLVLKNFHRQGISTRPNRDFSNNEVAGILAFLF